MKTTATIIALGLSVISVFAQPQRHRERIESAKIAMITQRLELTPEQAEKFWPIYREFNQKRDEIRKEFQAKRENMDPSTATEEQKQELLRENMNMKQNMLDLEKSYTDKFLTVISTEQLIKLRRTEEDFRRMILRQLQKRHRQNQLHRPRRDRW